MSASSFTEDRAQWDKYQRDQRQYAEFLARRIKDKQPGWRTEPLSMLNHDAIDVPFTVHEEPKE